MWKIMKALCSRRRVAWKKVFPHNLRHLFARTFYEVDKNIAKLADLLGHSSIETTRIYIMESRRRAPAADGTHASLIIRSRLPASEKATKTPPVAAEGGTTGGKKINIVHYLYKNCRFARGRAIETEA